MRLAQQRPKPARPLNQRGPSVATEADDRICNGTPPPLICQEYFTDLNPAAGSVPTSIEISLGSRRAPADHALRWLAGYGHHAFELYNTDPT